MNTETNIPTVTLETAIELLKIGFEQDQPQMWYGPSGIGKSDAVKQTAAELGIGFKLFIGSIKQPVDIAGLPVPDLKGNRTRWLRPEDLPDPAVDGERGLFFLDEINTCGQSMQASMFQVVLDRRAGTHELPKGWLPVAAGNRTIDRSAAQRTPAALANRFGNFNVVPCVKAFTKWAQKAGINPYLIAFLNFRPELLHVIPTGDMVAFPSPRAWVQSAKHFGRIPDLRLPLIGSQVGMTAAYECEGFLQVCQGLPTLQEIVGNPGGAKLPTETSAQWAVTALMARNADRSNFDAMLKYAERLGGEYEALFVTDAVRRQPDLNLRTAKGFSEWAVRNAEVVL